jgi:hypothetical protein
MFALIRVVSCLTQPHCSDFTLTIRPSLLIAMRRLQCQCLSAFHVPATSAAAKRIRAILGLFSGRGTAFQHVIEGRQLVEGSFRNRNTTTHAPPTQAKIDELDHILELKSHAEFSLRQQYDAAQAELAKKDQVIQDSERARRTAEAEVEALREQIVDAQTRREVDGDEVERLSQQRSTHRRRTRSCERKAAGRRAASSCSCRRRLRSNAS